MNMSDYWNKNSRLLESNHGYTIAIRKEILSIVMNISYKSIDYFINQDESYREFVLSGNDDIESFTKNEDRENLIYEGVLKIYSDDYSAIQSFISYKQREIIEPARQQSHKIDIESMRNDICTLIRRFVNSKTFECMKIEDRTFILFYEKIYVLPKEVMNQYIEISYNDKDLFREHLLSQWITANEMTAAISQQRSNMNNLYMSILTMLIGSALFSERFVNDNMTIRLLVYIAISIIGVSICTIWRKQIENYKNLNAAKFEVIKELESELPANILYYEWLITEKNCQNKNKRSNFTDQEKELTIIFEIFVIIIPLALIFTTLIVG